VRLFTLVAAASLGCGTGGDARAEADPSTVEAGGSSVETDRTSGEAGASSVGGDAGVAGPFSPARLDAYDFDERAWYVDLPDRLEEVSGLAFAPDGRLFAHDDERGRVYEIDPRDGSVGKHFDLGTETVRGDFEGLVVVRERFFLVTSTGLLYEFREGDDRARVDYRVTDSGVGAGCEVEGLDYDPGDDALLLACKIATPDRGTIIVHRVPMVPGRPRGAPLEIPRGQLARWDIDEDFAPSAIVVASSEVLFILSARQNAIIEVDRRGRIVAGVELRSGRHPQSEGLAIGPDGTLYLSDEKNGKDARLTAYTRSAGPSE
jgi:uncharacterized protein YjiK